ncbi:MAG: hypothetical protein ACRDHP_09670 [Ktedonobacterales bacterium]
MRARGRKELLCGLGSGFFGLLLLLVAYLQPYDESGTVTTQGRTVAYQSFLHPGFTPIELPYIIAIGVPILGIVAGATIHSLTRSANGRIVRRISTGALFLLLGGTVVTTLEASYGLIITVGLVLAPSAALGIVTSVLARDARPAPAQPTMPSAAS